MLGGNKNLYKILVGNLISEALGRYRRRRRRDIKIVLKNNA